MVTSQGAVTKQGGLYILLSLLFFLILLLLFLFLYLLFLLHLSLPLLLLSPHPPSFLLVPSLPLLLLLLSFILFILIVLLLLLSLPHLSTYPSYLYRTHMNPRISPETSKYNISDCLSILIGWLVMSLRSGLCECGTRRIPGGTPEFSGTLFNHVVERGADKRCRVLVGQVEWVGGGMCYGEATVGMNTSVFYWQQQQQWGARGSVTFLPCSMAWESGCVLLNLKPYPNLDRNTSH